MNELRVNFCTLGCKVNQYETEAMQKLFLAAGWKLTDENESADAIVVNTCTVTSLSSQKSRKIIRQAARAKKNSVLAVVGCYAQSEPEKISAIDGVDVIIGTADRAKIVELVETALKNRDEKIFHVEDVKNFFKFEELPHTPQRTRAFLKIQDGCDNFCSYCIIPLVRGKVRSRPPENIRAECLRLAADGYKEIVLTGIHIGAYGKDFGNKMTLADAVKIILETANPKRLRLGSVESAEMTDELLRLMKTDPRICNHIHLPLQSGSDEILRAMRRPYSTKKFSELTTKLVKNIPEISIGTDLIVGFPSETENLFEETINFLRSQPFSKIHVFPFSARKGTAAADMKNQIDSQTKKIRVARVLEIAREKENLFAEKFIGRTVEIISETAEGGFIDGLTKNYLRVYFPETPKVQLGELVTVKIDRLFKNGVAGILCE